MSMHITAQKGEISDKILLPGDPLRAKYIAETYLTDPALVNELRGALCYTGQYKGQRVSVMGTGMGIPAVLIYATELCTEYGCEKLIRIGTAGAFDPRLRKMDIVLSQATSTTSSLNDYIFKGHFAPVADFGLLKKAYEISEERGITAYVGNTLCNDHLYRDPRGFDAESWSEYGVLASEMEGAALYTVAAHYRKRALTVMTVVSEMPRSGEVNDKLQRETGISAEKRQNGLDDMIVLALDTVLD